MSVSIQNSLKTINRIPTASGVQFSTRSRCFQYTQILLKNKRENAKRP